MELEEDGIAITPGKGSRETLGLFPDPIWHHLLPRNKETDSLFAIRRVTGCITGQNLSGL
ncbi:MAG: hypothetical protein U9R25_04310 [Chloroflexota bacterium]|nr:hypothetical protein [Chloroflexota bacterium]